MAKLFRKMNKKKRRRNNRRRNGNKKAKKRVKRQFGGPGLLQMLFGLAYTENVDKVNCARATCRYRDGKYSVPCTGTKI